MRVASVLEGLSKGECRNIIMAQMRVALQPMSQFIKLKCVVFRGHSQVIEEQTAMMDRLRTCSCLEEAMASMPELEQLEQKLNQLDVPLAYADKGSQEQSWINAAAYSDEWSLWSLYTSEPAYALSR